ncbi:MAG: type I glutamate--ammonia ligase [Cenarchaeum sp. SB0661_bin_35]|nr:type I glutamate--ammonia ligase [Cenarchaeum sp. SB0667_bin_13]MXY37809.1 type I glutamate--ammonia ligase [Cenarchaeum sp. SB0664_bin_35]MXZ94073.1 type I glutamate--ammonia ligase [Cenarchaeum sp. SB0666_bin_15]MYB46737.1 type I glutamate--ammonia ligase [Cenarchaeum sp. SB0662_bin_33]MYC79666.1 type I glutamate--ammonia ligase [Cenarchaeum sp. SB0661_bin_35]MYD58915.1 type I glutamate--ammonia ligase [Cenarchaeum sp. SB0678_bin_8]MYI52326.1 type I glutamate--ammonia ligase [Cenarchaeum
MPYKFNGGDPKNIAHTSEQVFEMLDNDNIRFIDMQFTSLPGRFHHTTISKNTFTPDQMRDGLPKLDGSSIVGFASIEDSDLVLKPDPNTYAIIPWLTENRTARLICDVYWGEGRGRLSRDPRGIAQRAEKFIEDAGYGSYWGPEVEFFVFDKVHWDVLTPYKGQSYSIESQEAPWNQEGSGYPMGLKRGYYPSTPSDTLTSFRNECVNVLNSSFGILCDNHHHEVATAGQCEIDIMYDKLTNSADSAQSYKFIVRNVAQKFNKVATMMPKPITMDAGSGMHTNVSLWKDGENAFFDESEPDELSQLALYFCGGIMDHAKALSAICNPTTNSYHRLVPGYEAPAYIAWSSSNRSAIVRVPKHFKGSAHAKLKRLEFRAPDPSSNPYLVFSAVTAAGMDGVRRKISPAEPIQEDIFKMSKQERRQRGIDTLPATLGEALDALESDNGFLNPIFTTDAVERLIELGKQDQLEISVRPHPHEFYLYFDV